MNIAQRGAQAALWAGLCALAQITAAAPTPVFVNELHYDNTGADTGEGVEIAGPAGTDLAGWSVVLYNGNGGTAYDTIALSGTIPDQCGGFGTLWFPRANIQNGVPDGLALVDDLSGVVQFLSYEGVFVAVGGPADGLTSTDLGVFEPGSDAIGMSLQRTGTGNVAEDFIWSGPATASPGACNAGQTFVAALQPELLLSEIVVTPTGGEYLEIFNPNAAPVDLSDVYLTDATFAGGGTFYYNIVTGNLTLAGGGGFGDFHARFPDGASIAPGQYQTVALTGSDAFFATYGQSPDYELFEDGMAADAVPDMREALPGSINAQGALSNDGEVAILYTWDGVGDLLTDLDYAVWGDKAEAVDKSGVAVDGPDADGLASTYLNDTPIANQDIVAPAAHAVGDSFQREDLFEGSEISTGGNGANGHDETSEDFTNTWCQGPATPGAMTVCNAPPAAGVIINEINADPDATGGDANGDGTVNTTNDEFVEIVNNTGAPLDMSGWTLSDGVSVRHTFPAGTVIAEQCAVVVFAGGTPTGVFGGATVQVASSGALGLNNTGDSITVNDGLIDRAIAAYGAEGGNNQSLTLDPDITGIPPYVQHSIATGSGGALFSPGTRIDGGNLPGCIVAPPIVINEIHADPDNTGGDANGDGVLNTSNDEFVEIYNNTGAPLDLSGWTLADVVGVRHTFPAGTVIADRCAVTVFGGGTPTGGFGGATTQTASTGTLGLNNGGDTVTLNDGSTDRASVVYGAEGGNNQSLTLDPDILGTNYVQHSVATGSAGALYSPGTLINGANFAGCTPPPPVLVCGAAATPIHAVQGNGATSPLAGSPVQVEGVVVADFQGASALSGFFLQEEDADVDADPATSEGVFIFDSTFGVDVQTGDRVRVAGTVEEFNENTEISSVNGVAVCASGVLGEVTRTDLTLPVATLDDLEALEGMWVRMAQALTVSDVFDIVRFGEFVASNGRLYTPTQIVAPGAPAQAQDAANLLNQVVVDDARNGANQMPFVVGADDTNPLDAQNPVRNGFTLTNLEGALNFAFGDYRIQPTQPLVFDEAANPRPGPPAPPASDLRLASFNVFNFFTTLDVPGNTCGPNALSCRGANTAGELTRQTDKLVTALIGLNADVVALIEVENDSDDSTLQRIVNSLNSAAGSSVWQFIASGFLGTDAIKPAFIYRTDRARPVGPFAVLDETVDPRFDTSRQRPSVAQTFADTNNGMVNVVVNHLRSKGSCPNDGSANDDNGDGQACWNQWRTLSMQAMVDWLPTDPTGQGDPDFLLVGDFNSYAQEDPLQVLAAAGFSNLEIQFNGGNPAVYSFTIFGLAGSLDHAIANASIAAQVSDTQTWHINADEYVGFDFNEEDLPGSGGVNLPKPANFYNVDPYRTSDHDPLLISLDLNSEVTAGFTLANSNVAESAGTLNLALNLDRAPIFDVQLRVQSTGGTATAGTDYTAVDQVITILAGTTSRSVPLTLLQDALVEGSETVVLTVSDVLGAAIGASSTHQVTITDDDAPGAVVTPTSGLVTTEGGGTAVFTVVLTSAPTATVNIPLVSGNPAEGDVSTAMLSFDSGNWSVPQPVTVTGVDDAVLDGDQPYTIQVGPAASNDPFWQGLVLSDVAVTNLDDETAVTLISGPTATGSGAAAISFTGGGPLCTFDPVATGFVNVSSVAVPPPAGLIFPHGLVQLQISGCNVGGSVTFELMLPQALGENSRLWKFGNPGNGGPDQWFEFPAVIAGDTVTYTLTDGGPGDGDGSANGEIVDPAGPTLAGVQAVPVPVFDRRSLWWLILALFATGAAFARHRWSSS